MRKFNALFSLTAVILLVACSWTPNFMGAEKWNNVGGYYIERWFLNPDKPTKVPEGTGFYGAAAEKIKDRFIVKYYIAKNDGDSTIEIPTKDMWKVKHNGKDETEQDHDNLFFYIRNRGGMIKQKAIPVDIMLPIKACSIDGWCQMYITNSNLNRPDETLYVKRSILYQGPTILNKKQKAKLARDAIHATPATYPWITPTAQACTNNSGEMNSRGVCQAKWKAANRICKVSGGRLPTIDELKKVVIQCGGSVWVPSGNIYELPPAGKRNVPGYEACYRQKGFNYEAQGYFSSTIKVTQRNTYPSETNVMYMGDSYSSTNIEPMNYPTSFLCIVREEAGKQDRK